MFEYSEDKLYFDQLLSGVGGFGKWERLFDTSDPIQKRKDFGKIRDELYRKLLQKDGASCQLKLHSECSDKADEVDHLIPLKTNVLSKELRYMRGSNGKKVKASSYGSNHLDNLVLACSRCNAFKKHRLPSYELLIEVLSKRRITCC